MRIDRPELLDELQSFVLRGNGIIVGSPGVGKTCSIWQLHNRLNNGGVPHLLLAIDQLGEGTPEDLHAELSYEGDLIAKLREEIGQLGNQPGILLFDAFDAARGEQSQKRFLRIIRRCVKELKGLWTVIVAVRTYDAKKSQELLELFGKPLDSDPPFYRTNDIPCRHFSIPLLTEGEIEQALSQISGMGDLYRAGSDDLRELLKVPFNLWLLEKIATADTTAPNLTMVRSEVQLLKMFWDRRIRGKRDVDQREFLLTRMVRLMVNGRSLSIRKENLYRPELQQPWSGLLSDEVLAEVSSAGQRVAFSHNILFDYAVSVLLIEDEPEDLLRFVSEDPSRPLFLRPSLTYYLVRLWYDTPNTFWEVFWRMLPSSDLHLRLFARLLPPSTIATEARELEQLTPLVTALPARTLANEATLRLLQALRALDIERDELWVRFLEEASGHLHESFAWDLAIIASGILDRAAEAGNDTVLRSCGRIGRRLLQWVWRQREGDKSVWVNGLGANWGVPLVAKTYGTNLEESRHLLARVLELTSEDDFPIDFVLRLAYHADDIWPHDPEFVTDIYFTIFSHNEASDERTDFGSFVLPLSSTRRQDFGLCQHVLTEHFPNFLRAAPLPATRAAIESLNAFIVVRHIAGYLAPSARFEDLPEEFEFRGGLAHYMADWSHFWDEGLYADEPIKIANELFGFMAEMASSSEEVVDVDSWLNVFRDNVWVAFFWRRLLRTAAHAPGIFAGPLFELCIARPIQTGSETLHELGIFLEAAASDFTDAQLRRVEQSILALPKDAQDDEERHRLERRRDRLLARIPMELLRTNEGKTRRGVMSETASTPENKPLVRFESWSEPYSEEKELVEQGVDLKSARNEKLLKLLQPLEQFTSEYTNKTPTSEAIAAILPKAREVNDVLGKAGSAADEEVLDLAWSRLAACAETMSRAMLERGTEEFEFCREVLLRCAYHHLPKPDPQFDANYTFPVWSPEPRNEAAQGLPLLAERGSDAEILRAVESLVHDKVPSVRFLIATGLFRLSENNRESFWKLAEHIAEHEENGVVQQGLCHSLNYVVAQEETKAIEVIEKLANRVLLHDEENGASESLVSLVMWLALVRNNPRAIEITNVLLRDPLNKARILRQATLAALRYVTPQSLDSREGREIIDRAIDWLRRAIEAAAAGTAELQALSKGHWTEETSARLKDIYGVIDEVVVRLYFAADVREDLRAEKRSSTTDEQRERYYFKVKPLLEWVLNSSKEEPDSFLLAPTAHHFMELLNGVLKYDPRGVLHLAASVAQASKPYGYNLDSLAAREVVALVEAALADHRVEIRNGEALRDLLNLLDTFADTGWPDALRMVWRLDEVFR